MTQDKRMEAANRLEEALLNSGKSVYVLRLYVSGQTARSVHAIENIKHLCEEFLKDRHEIEVIDVYAQPERLKEAQIIGVPTLIKELPLPVRRFIGDLSNQENLIVGLDLRNIS
ncbi:MAG: circadian clock KaiB family protein [Deltaproteobacteria bacterium]|nr:circadian clock KaiB family protein [Deltaproteobacteria bacterium]